MASKSQSPRVTFALLADGHKVGERGKVDCFGIFNNLGVWAVPARRECSVAFGIKDIPKGELIVSFWLRRKGQRPRSLAKGVLTIDSSAHAASFANRIPLVIESFRAHEVGVCIGTKIRGRNVLWTPLLIVELPWPALPKGSRLQRVLRDPQSLKAARAVLKCVKCDNEYIFQANLDPNMSLDEVARPFPPDGKFKCPECGTVHHLRDIQGQALAHLAQTAEAGAK
jgi:hypothetical protein